MLLNKYNNTVIRLKKSLDNINSRVCEYTIIIIILYIMLGLI